MNGTLESMGVVSTELKVLLLNNLGFLSYCWLVAWLCLELSNVISHHNMVFQVQVLIFARREKKSRLMALSHPGLQMLHFAPALLKSWHFIFVIHTPLSLGSSEFVIKINNARDESVSVL